MLSQLETPLDLLHFSACRRCVMVVPSWFLVFGGIRLLRVKRPIGSIALGATTFAMILTVWWQFAAFSEDFLTCDTIKLLLPLA